MQPTPRGALAFGGLSLGLTLLALASLLGSSSLAPVARLAWSAFASSAALVAFALSGALFGSSPMTEALGLERSRVRWPHLAGMVVGTIALSHALDLALRLGDWRRESVLHDITVILEGARGPDLLLALLGMSVAAGIAEELLFRGWLLRRLDASWGSAAAVLASSAAFGALHLDLAQGAAAGALGVYLAWVALRAGSTRAAMLCHVVNNGVAVVGAALVQGR